MDSGIAAGCETLSKDVIFVELVGGVSFMICFVSVHLFRVSEIKSFCKLLSNIGI